MRFLPKSGFQWTDPKRFDSNKYSSNSSKSCVLEVNLEYPKELRVLSNDYPFAPDKIETKKGMLSKYQLMISDFFNIPIGNVNWCLIFLIKKSMCFNVKTYNFI